MSANVYPTINLAYHGEGFADSPEGAAVIAAKASKHALELFDVIERRLEGEGPFLLGGTVSAADLYLFMLTVWETPGERLLHERCPRIAALCGEVRSRPKLRAALEVHGVDKIGG
jgi:glutathione S-transferase